MTSEIQHTQWRNNAQRCAGQNHYNSKQKCAFG